MNKMFSPQASDVDAGNVSTLCAYDSLPAILLLFTSPTSGLRSELCTVEAPLPDTPEMAKLPSLQEIMVQC